MNDITYQMKELATSEKGMTFVYEHGEEFISYRQIWDKGQRLCSLLEKNAKKQSCVAIYCIESTNLVYALWACAIGNFIAIPIEVDTNKVISNTFFEQFDYVQLVTDMEICPNTVIGDVINLQKKDWEIIPLCEEKHEGFYNEEDYICIQFSSGTTGQSKGIPISRKNLLANLKDEIQCFQVKENDLVVNWEPLTHSGGLIIFHYMSIIAGLSQYFIPPDVYVKDPLIWFDIVSKSKATLTGTVPFALRHFLNMYRNSVREFDWDLSSLKVMTLGAEHVGIQLYQEFVSEMKKYGLRPECIVTTYGLSEATCLVGYGINKGEFDLYILEDKEFHYRGKVIPTIKGTVKQEYILYSTISPSVEVRITDEEGNVVPDQTVGNIQIKGPAVIKGYYSKKGIITDDHFSNGWFDTGDLGFLVNNKHLGIIGRIKDIVVIGGENYECSSLENIIRSRNNNPMIKDVLISNLIDKNGIECVGAFVFCPEFKETDEEIIEFGKCAEFIREELFSEYGIYVDVILPINEIPRSGSGKVRRIDLKMKYSSGGFTKLQKILKEGNSKKMETEAKRYNVPNEITKIVESEFNVCIEDYNKPFQEYGIVSINVPRFISCLEQRFELDLKASVLFNYPNVDKLSKYISSLLKERLDERTNFQKEPEFNEETIAIVGLSCRFPNGANNPEEFWKMLVDGVDAIQDIPEFRWNADKYYSTDDNEAGKMYCKKGAFLNQPIDEFDSKFFNISPKEAEELDPHHRMLIELTWEAFENAGLDIYKYNGSKTGVFLGLASDEYAMTSVSSGDVTKIDSYSLTGVCKSTACGRISYLFGFEGPCFSVDTACSSVLTALHQACLSIKNHDSDAAIVGGASLMISPTIGIAFSKLHATSHDGHCKTFDANADGYARGEGGGVIILKRLSDAERDHDNIIGIVRASGLNQDGKSNGLTAPNGESQRKLIESTMEKAGLKPNDIDYVETHGTGTALGDPIEVNAIIDAYGQYRTTNTPLRIGSVKSNIGHLEAASGMASIIKVLLSLKHGMIPRNLNFSNPNPQIAWDKANIEVVDKNTKWDAGTHTRRAAINSFGFGGSNGHVIIEEYIPKNQTHNRDLTNKELIIKVSAKSEGTLKQLAGEYADCLEKCSEEELYDVMCTANFGRADLPNRLAVSGATKEEIIKKLKDYAKDDNVILTGNKRKVVFMYTGQGSQYVNMGRQLYEKDVVFKSALDECDKLFRQYLLKSIVQLVYDESAKEEIVEKTVYAQPLIFSIEYALSKTWESYGVTPDMVIGHSIGEYAAAVIAGIMSLDTAVKLVAARGRLMDNAPGEGIMATVFADYDTTQSFIGEYSDQVVVAVQNAQEACVISGDKELVMKICEKAEDKGIRVRLLKVSHGFHSPLMKQAAEEFKEVALGNKYFAPQITFLSCMYSRYIEDEILDAYYWAEHICRKVDFYNTIKLIENEEDVFLLEVGPDSTLNSLCNLIFGKNKIFASSMSRKNDNIAQMTDCIAKLYMAGVDFDWGKVGLIKNRYWKRSDLLPNYPYTKSKYWKQVMYDRIESGIRTSVDANTLLGQRIESCCLDNTVIFQREYTSEEPYFMREHIIYNTAIAPAASYVSILISAMKEIRNPKSITINDIELRAPLIVTETESRMVQVCITDVWSEKCGYKIVSKSLQDEKAEWIIHSQGTISVHDSYVGNNYECEIDRWNLTESDTNEENIVYRAMVNAGFALGIGFRRVMRSECTSTTGTSYIEPLKSLPHKEKYILYPGIIDSIFHTMLSIILEAGQVKVEKEDSSETMIPYFVTGISYNYVDSDKLWCSSNAVFEHKSIIGNVEAFNESGQLVMQIDNMITKITTEKDLLSSLKKNYSELYYNEKWVNIEVDNSEDDKYDGILLLTDKEEAFGEIVTYWEKKGIKVKIINPNGYDEKKWQDLLKEECKPSNHLLIVYAYGMENDDVYDSLHGAVDMTHAILEKNLESECSVFFVTENANPLLNSNLRIGQETLWGFAKSFGMEYAKLFAGMLDIIDDSNSIDYKNVAEIILSKESRELCIRKGKIYEGRLLKRTDYDKQTQSSLSEIKVDSKVTYVIAGGLGMLGIVYAESLIRLGAKNIALLGRKSPKLDTKRIIDKWCEDGINVKSFKVDVCDINDLSHTIMNIQNDMPMIKGIINAAGVLRDRMIQDLEWKDYEYVCDPKVKGSMNLYNETKDNNLDFFIMLSSITSVFGNIGQSNYAAANYFMNCFAEYINQQGGNGYVFCWGPWEGAGMATDETTIKNMEMMGMRPITIEDGANMICEFFRKPYSLLLVADINWEKFGKNAAGTIARRRLSGLINEKEEKKKSDIYDSVKELRNMNADEAVNTLVRRIRGICAQVMGYASADDVDPRNTFKELGADSLMLFTIRTEINQLLDANINVASFYNYPNIIEFAQYLVNDVLLIKEINEQDALAENSDLEKDSEIGNDMLAELVELLN